ncbi:MAG: tetratricopeptide repeat protein, partial [Planctomycetes bacterium]|nr:tetratricopeptide repeat protein [Planctomycetota bacterium]
MSEEPRGPSDGTHDFVPSDNEKSPAEASTPNHGDEEQAGMMIGPFKLLQRLGKGGMGVVWMAEQREPVQRYVAIKIVKSTLHGSQVMARFEAERQALAMMDHPNIAKVLDAGTIDRRPLAPREDPLAEREVYDTRPYFVMELVKGVSFTQYCDQEKLTIRERIELFIPDCHAVQHAHQKGVVHRDLKPSNVLIALYDGKPVPKVIDFGVAKALHQKLTENTMFTEVGQIVGTIEYMAPEQAELNNLDIDTRAESGESHPDTLSAINGLALAHLDHGEPDKGIAILEAIVRRWTTSGGPDQFETLQAMSTLAEAYARYGRLDKALETRSSIWQILNIKLGHGHPETLAANMNLAKAHLDAGDQQAAFARGEETVQAWKDRLGPKHNLTLRAEEALGQLYSDAKRHDLEIALRRESLKKHKDKLGNRHVNTIMSCDWLAGAYVRDKRFDEALKLSHWIADELTAGLGADHRRTLDAKLALAMTLREAKEYEKSVAEYADTIPRLRSNRGLDRSTRWAMFNFAVACLAAKRSKQAKDLLDEALDADRKKLGSGTLRLADNLDSLARDLLEYKEHGVAEPILRESLGIRGKLKPNAWATFELKSLLGASLLGQKKHKEAESMLKEGYEGMRMREKTIPFQSRTALVDALERLVQL